MSHGTATAVGRWCAAAHGAPATVADHGRDAHAAPHRSDPTLNLDGVGTVTADLHEFEEALVVGAGQAGGGSWMPRSVRLVDAAVLDEPLLDTFLDDRHQRLADEGTAT